MKLFNFLGSITFAIILIASTLVLVGAGTFIESVTGSHLYAAQFTYSSPFFQMLLWGYFLNILLATLKRYPFKRQHIPFIITHIGLLMLLAGVLIKSHFGIQGRMSLLEGAESSSILIQNSYAVHIETPKKAWSLPLKAQKTGSLPSPLEGLTLAVKEWHPHAEQQVSSIIDDKRAHIWGYPPLPLVQLKENKPSLRTHEYDIYAIKDENPSNIVFPKRAALFFIQDPLKNEYLIAFNNQGERFTHTFDNSLFLVFDKGFGGYASLVHLPKNFPKIELATPFNPKIEPKCAHKQLEKLQPCIDLVLSEGNEVEKIRLLFDKEARAFKWPVLNGKYLVRFQPQRYPLPFAVRLKRALQINYEGTEQPFKYESEIEIENEEFTISMNHVHERKGIRLYMAGLGKKPLSASRAEIIVNHDPAKYFLTYPGGILLAIGILLLYLRRRYA